MVQITMPMAIMGSTLGFSNTKKRKVRDLLGCPHTMVSRVVNHQSLPLALVSWVLLGGMCQFTTTRSLFPLGVDDLGWLPLTILFIIPILRLDSI